MATARVVLEIEYDEVEYPHPDTWNWTELADVPSARVIDSDRGFAQANEADWSDHEDGQANAMLEEPNG